MHRVWSPLRVVAGTLGSETRKAVLGIYLSSQQKGSYVHGPMAVRSEVIRLGPPISRSRRCRSTRANID